MSLNLYSTNKDLILDELLKYSFLFFNKFCVDENFISMHMQHIVDNFTFNNSIFTYAHQHYYLDLILKLSNNADFTTGITPHSFYLCFKYQYFFLAKMIYPYIKNMQYNRLNKHFFTLCFEEACINQNTEMVIFLIKNQYDYCRMIDINDRLMNKITSINILFVLSALYKDKMYSRIYLNKNITFEISNIEYIFFNNKKCCNDIEACSICYDKNSTIITECKHQYCLSCIGEWILSDNFTCPLCRQHIDKNNCYYIHNDND